MRIRIDEKRRGARVVLSDVAFDVREGEVVALLGPSGIGKTTLLRIVAGLDDDFSGAIEGAGRIGLVFQEPTLIPWRTARDNLRIAAGVDPATAARLLVEAGLDGRIDAFPTALSLGQARRVALARAFAFRPDTLLLDEPFVSLDAGAAERMEAALKRLIAATRVRTLLVTHRAEETVRLADRVLLLGGEPGSVVAERPLLVPRAERDRGWLTRETAALEALLTERGAPAG